MKDEPRANLLIADDNREHRQALAKIFSKEGYTVALASDGEEAIDILSKDSFELIITDLRMPRKGGLQLLKEIKDKSPQTMVIIVTAYGEYVSYHEAMSMGAFDYLNKPIKREEILLVAEKALTWKKEIDEIRCHNSRG